MNGVHRAWKFGDNIDTDVLAPGRYMKGGIEELAKHCLEAIDSTFASHAKPGDIVVAGKNFGMGSSREQAAQALLHLGIYAVIAPSFGGIFYRNAFNLGLLAIVCADSERIRTGAEVTIDPETGIIENLSTDETYQAEPVPAFLLSMIKDGGLVPHLERKLAS